MSMSTEQKKIVDALKKGDMLRAWISEGWSLVSEDGTTLRVDGRAVHGLMYRGMLSQVKGNSMVWTLRPGTEN